MSFYLIAKGGVASVNKGSGDNPALAFLAVLGGAPPAKVTINEMTTVASVWTNAQFLDGPILKGPALSLGIAAGNAPNFVDLQTGGWGTLIQSSLNSGQTPTMAIFATLADALAGCATRVTVNACDNLYLATTPPKGDAPTDTLTAAEAVARYPWYVPERLFTLLGQLYPVAQGKTMRPVPFMPYLNYAPSAWVLALKVDGGGYRAGGGAEFDSEGNLWTGDNFTVGWQGDDTLWQGNATKFAPNGRPLSPMTTGFAGGGMQGGSFGLAIDAHDNAWFPTYGGKSIAVFDKNGKPLTPPDGITFDGKLGLMQGAIATPSGDVWVVGLSKNQLVHFPGGDPTKGKLLCEGDSAEPCKSLSGPFHLAIDQQDRIWVSNALSDHVTRFPASDPSKAETFAAGYSGSGLSVDSRGNVWVSNRLGSSLRGLAKFVEVGLVAKTGGNADEALLYKMLRTDRRLGRRQRDCAATGRQPIPGIAVLRAQSPRTLGHGHRWRRQRLGLQLHRRRRSTRASVRRAYRKLSARLQNWRTDFAAIGLCRRRPANGNRSRDRPRGQRLGDEQLAGHRRLLPPTVRSPFDSVRRRWRHDLLRHG